MNSGRHLLTVSFSGFDPTETLAAPSGILLMPILAPIKLLV
jgi:hypothetical protein